MSTINRRRLALDLLIGLGLATWAWWALDNPSLALFVLVGPGPPPGNVHLAIVLMLLAAPAIIGLLWSWWRRRPGIALGIIMSVVACALAAALQIAPARALVAQHGPRIAVTAPNYAGPLVLDGPIDMRWPGMRNPEIQAAQYALTSGAPFYASSHGAWIRYAALDGADCLTTLARFDNNQFPRLELAAALIQRSVVDRCVDIQTAPLPDDYLLISNEHTFEQRGALRGYFMRLTRYHGGQKTLLAQWFAGQAFPTSLPTGFTLIWPGLEIGDKFGWDEFVGTQIARPLDGEFQSTATTAQKAEALQRLGQIKASRQKRP